MEANPLAELCRVVGAARGDECAAVVQQALDRPGAYLVGGLLEVPSVRALATTHPLVHRQLEVFAYGTYTDYLAQPDLPSLSATQALKLRHLTIVSLASHAKSLPYSQLLPALCLANVRQLEDVVIEGIYQEVFKGVIDQVGQHIEIDWAIGRDIRPGQVHQMAQKLSNWAATCESVLSMTEQLMTAADVAKANSQQRQTALDQEVERVRGTLSAAKALGGPQQGRLNFKSMEYHNEESRRGGKRVAKEWDGRPRF